MVDEIALKRFEKAGNAEASLPAGALNRCLADLRDADADIQSVMIIAVDSDGDSRIYMAGPHLSSYTAAWMVLQGACLRMIQMITCGE